VRHRHINGLSALFHQQVAAQCQEADNIGQQVRRATGPKHFTVASSPDQSNTTRVNTSDLADEFAGVCFSCQAQLRAQDGQATDG
jgi:hypothetical protein